MRGRNHRLRRRRGDGHDHVRTVSDELAGNLHGRALVALSALIGPVQALAILVARVLQLVVQAVTQRIQRRVLDDGQDRDRRRYLASGRSGCSGTAVLRHGGGHGGRRHRAGCQPGCQGAENEAAAQSVMKCRHGSVSPWETMKTRRNTTCTGVRAALGADGTVCAARRWHDDGTAQRPPGCLNPAAANRR